jgi:enamine deaminase RidA (YjgF/YER057c/UK114 family)
MTASIQRLGSGPRMSQVVQHRGVAYLAGQVPQDLNDDIRGQARQVLAAIDRLLVEAGSHRQALLSATVYLADMADFAAMNEVWEAWVPPGHAPARATVQARMARPDCRVEVVVTAAL